MAGSLTTEEREELVRLRREVRTPRERDMLKQGDLPSCQRERVKFALIAPAKADLPAVPNALARQFAFARPTPPGSPDITDLWTHARWYLAVILDLLSRAVAAGLSARRSREK